MSVRPLIDSLESRRLMSVVPVLNTNDSGAGSLRQAIHNALTGDTIDASGLVGTITLSSGAITIDKNLKIVGSGDTSLTVDANSAGHAFVVNIGVNAEMNRLTITNGNTDQSGGAILSRGNLTLNVVEVKNSHAFLFGGGIYSIGGDVTLINSTLTGNTVSGALEASGGGLYMNGGRLTIDSSTVHDNSVTGASNPGATSGLATGGGIYLTNTLASTITRSTFGQNSASGGTGGLQILNGQAMGGAIYIDSAASTAFNSCTIAYNQADGGGLGLQSALSRGGGLYSTGGGTVTMAGVLTSQNQAINSPDILSSTLVSLGNNLVGIFAGNSILSTLLGDKYGSVLTPLAPGLSNVLANNGGQTLTYALQANSPAINAGASTAPTLDQRGLGRRTAPDMGAFEFNGNHLPVLGDAGATFNSTAGDVFTQAILSSDGDDDALTYSASDLPSWLSLRNVNGAPTLTGSPTEANAGLYSIALTAADGFNTTAVSLKIRVGVPPLALSKRGLLRINGSENADTVAVFARGRRIRVIRNGVVKNYAQSAVKAIQVYGFGGNDMITVNDRSVGVYVDAGMGDDVVTGGAGYDILSGGMGNDTIYGNAGDDRLNGNAGNDVLYGGEGNDRLFGGKGSDRLFAGYGTNTIFGDEGNDYVNAKNGTVDVIDGGLGSNVSVLDTFDSVVNAVLAAA